MGLSFDVFHHYAFSRQTAKIFCKIFKQELQYYSVLLGGLEVLQLKFVEVSVVALK